jgi:hypothetical protein
MISGQASGSGLVRGQNSTIEVAGGFVSRGIRKKVTGSSGKTKTDRDVAASCRLRWGSSSAHLGIRHTVGFLDGNMCSSDGEDLWELVSVRFEDARELPEIGHWRFFRTSLKSMVNARFIRRIGRLSFGFCENLDHADSARESKLQRIGRAAFRYCSLKLIEIHRLIEMLEKLGFSTLGVEVIIFELGSV